MWRERGMAFADRTGTRRAPPTVRKSFQRITASAGLDGTWTPRELRHSFVSIMSAYGVRIETIADLVGHAGTRVTKSVYRLQLSPEITQSAEAMNEIFGVQGKFA
ncbi:hypothetical protein HerbRD11066_14100 [Herbidospora sp. RD11066]